MLRHAALVLRTVVLYIRKVTTIHSEFQINVYTTILNCRKKGHFDALAYGSKIVRLVIVTQLLRELNIERE